MSSRFPKSVVFLLKFIETPIFVILLKFIETPICNISEAVSSNDFRKISVNAPDAPAENLYVAIWSVIVQLTGHLPFP